MAAIQERRARDGQIRYRVQIRLRGFPPESATFDRKTDAKKWAAQTEAAIREGRYFRSSEARKHTLADAIDRYTRNVLANKSQKSRKTQGTHLAWWRQQLGNLMLADVTPVVIAEARDALANGKTRYGAQRSPQTVVHYMNALSHVFTIASKEWGWIEDNPVRRVSKPKVPRGRVRFLSTEERERLLAACKESKNSDLYPIVILALSTGMRKSEIMNLTWKDIDFDRGMLIMHETKNQERRSAPLTSLALELIKRRSKVRRIDTDLVFPAPHRFGKEPQPIDFRTAWDRVLKRAGIEDFHFHDLRHTAASYLLMSGATLGELAEILGHKTLQMVKRYSHLSDSHASVLVKKMNRQIFESDRVSG